MQFTKMQGAGNDYVYVNAFEERLPSDLPELARRIADRHFGVGGDGLVVIAPSERADARMRMFNLDGSESEMCGNAIRCVGKYLYDHGIARQDAVRIETGRGVLSLDLVVERGKVSQARVNMGPPILASAEIPTTLPGDPPLRAALNVAGRSLEVTCVSMGNPHCVILVDELTDELVHGLGPQIERHSAFPRKTNVEFMRIISPREFEMRVWERGSGETLACGTGACASAVAGILNERLERRVVGRLLGGELTLEWPEGGDVFMTGPAVEVFTGDWPTV
ncbi:MAG: diaminopimelate epimerase [Planctomyces sp.]|nr:diaminopimelate epimerase [Planctomyces sp.]